MFFAAVANPATNPSATEPTLKSTSTAQKTCDNVPYEQMAKQIDGPELTLKDAEILCASARFCHRGGDIWDQIPQIRRPQTKRELCT